jgi:hypothetical protein
MASEIADAIRNSMCDAAVDALDSGAGEPVLQICASNDDVLLEIDLNATAAFGNAGAVTVGKASAAAPVSGGGSWSTFSQVPDAAGTANYAQYLDGDGTLAFKSSVSTIAAGTGEVQFTTLTFDVAVAVTTTVAPSVTMPAG